MNLKSEVLIKCIVWSTQEKNRKIQQKNRCIYELGIVQASNAQEGLFSYLTVPRSIHIYGE